MPLGWSLARARGQQVHPKTNIGQGAESDHKAISRTSLQTLVCMMGFAEHKFAAVEVVVVVVAEA